MDDNVTKGAWIINSGKHLIKVQSNTSELELLGATEMAAKAGALLARLVADKTEVINSKKVRVFAREAGLSRGDIPYCLTQLKKAQKVDYTINDDGEPAEVEVYCFSVRDCLDTTARILDASNPSEFDLANIVSLDYTFQLPREEGELITRLTDEGLDEERALTMLRLQGIFDLTKTSQERPDAPRLYYNEHAFEKDPRIISKALKAMSEPQRRQVEDVQQYVRGMPGRLYEDLVRRFGATLVRSMEGVGLLDGIDVESAIGKATFMTLPQLKGPIAGTSELWADVFHKAKLLLGCLRFGELKSHSGRGRIDTHEKMMNIVNKLVRGERVGPCTAIGQDYVLLEREGTITTTDAGAGMRFMTLRQKEVGQMVQQILMLGQVVDDVALQGYYTEQPDRYTIPEIRRSQVQANEPRGIAEVKRMILEVLRT